MNYVYYFNNYYSFLLFFWLFLFLLFYWLSFFNIIIYLLNWIFYSLISSLNIKCGIWKIIWLIKWKSCCYLTIYLYFIVNCITYSKKKRISFSFNIVGLWFWFCNLCSSTYVCISHWFKWSSTWFNVASSETIADICDQEL